MSGLNPDDNKPASEGPEVDTAISTFDQLDLKDGLLRGIRSYGFEKPFGIQARAILPIVSGRDVIVQAQPGMGKTTSVVISTLQRVDTDLHEPQALILSPTRELATQIHSIVVALGESMNTRCHACVGGTSVAEDIRKLDYGVDVVSGTPGRVFDLIRRKHLRTRNIKVVVYEKADGMLQKGFRDQVYDIHRYLPRTTQTVLLSDTLPRDLLQTTEKLMKDPIRILQPGDELLQ